jgi:ABC-type uncharacterized transport system permease subunit
MAGGGGVSVVLFTGGVLPVVLRVLAGGVTVVCALSASFSNAFWIADFLAIVVIFKMFTQKYHVQKEHAVRNHKKP